VGPIIFTVNFLFSIYYCLLGLRAILPWIKHDKNFWIIRPIYQATEPVLSVIRLGFPPRWMGADYSPYVTLVLVWLMQQLILKLFF